MATQTISGPKIKIQVTGTIRNTLGDDAITQVAHPACSISPSLANGVSAGQCNRGWQRKATTIVKGAQETIDLYDFVNIDIGAGAGRDGLGQLIAYEEIVCIVVFNENDNDAAGILEVFPASSQGWTPIGTHTVATAGAFHGQSGIVKFDTSEAGFQITDAVSHRITLRAVSGDVSVSIYILARHDDNESSSSSSSPSSLSSISASSSSQSASTSSSSSSQSTSSSNSSSSLSSVSSSSVSSSSVSSASSPSSASSESSSQT